MRNSRWIRAGLFWALVAVAGRAAESRVAIMPGLAGAWVVPDRAWDGRTVLLFHGMASDMDDVGDLLKRLADGLAARGIASLRINFRGEGDKLRTRLESTFTSRLEDAAAAQAWVLRQPGVAPGRIGAQGFSLGGPTAVVTAARHPDWFRSIAVWSTPSGDLFALWDHDETAQRALREGEATEVIPGWKKLTTRREFYESFRGIDFDRALAGYPGAFLTVRAADDYLPHRDDALVKLAPGRPAEAVIIGGGDHIFKALEPGATAPARVLDLTVSWFERTL